MAKKTYKVAVIGGGNMGRFHIRTYKNLSTQLGNIELVALADINPEAQQLADEYNIKFYTNYQEMLDKEQPDAVSVVVPTPLHHQLGLEIIQRGIHCLVEKPIATTLAEAEELMAAARKHNVVFTVGHIERYNPMIQTLKELIIDKKELGEVTSIVVKRVGGFPAVEPKTDVLIDLAIHDIEIMSYLLGCQPQHSYVHGSKTIHSSKNDSIELLLDYGKASGFVQANWVTPTKIRTIALTGAQGYVEGNYITQEVVHYKHMQRKPSDGFDKFVASYGEPETRVINPKPQEPLALELAAFLQAIETGDQSQIVQPQAAYDALKVALEVSEKMSA